MGSDLTFSLGTHASRHAAGGADPVTPDAIAAAAKDLSNVDTSTATAGDVVTYDGTDIKWGPAATSVNGVTPVDGAVILDAGDVGAVTAPRLDDSVGSVPAKQPSGTVAYQRVMFTPEMFGAAGDGVTDDTSAVNSAIAAAQHRGGGQVLLDPAKTYLCQGCIAPAWSADAMPVQKPVRITSYSTGTSNGYWAPSPLNGGATLDLRYAGTDGLHPAKIDTRGAGWLEIDHINLVSGGTDNFPFVQTTNTTVDIHHNAIIGNTANTGGGCVQDAILFGGLHSKTIGNAAGAPFQGYGSKVRDCYFSHIRRGFVGGVYCNNIAVEGNTFSTSCGNSAGGAIEFHGDDGTLGGQYASGNITRGNTVEVSNYQYGLAAYYATLSTFGPDGYYDPTSVYNAAVYVDGTCQYNKVIDGFRDDGYPLCIDPSGRTTVETFHQSQTSLFVQPQRFLGPLPHAVINPSGSGLRAVGRYGNDAAIIARNDGYPYSAIELNTGTRKQVTDAVTVTGSPVVTSASAGWTFMDVGMPISGAGIPYDAQIYSVQSATQVTMTANASASATGVTVAWNPGNGESAKMTQVLFGRTHMLTQGSVGSASPTGNAGAGATASASGTDMALSLTLTTGTGPSAGAQVNIAQGINWSAVPKVSLTPTNAAAAAAMSASQVYLTKTTGNVTLNAGVALPASTELTFDIVAIQ